MKRASALAFATLAAWSGAAGALRAATWPTPTQLAVRNRIASGIDDWSQNEREAWVLRTGGLDGELNVARHDDSTRSDLTLGPFVSARGVDRDRRWHQTDNGETVIDSESRVDPKKISERVGRVRGALDAWVDTTAYADGSTLRTFYDPASWLIVRYERFTGDRTEWTAYDDFRSDARGRSRPWHYAGGSDRSETGYDYRLVRDDEPSSFPAGTFAIPHDRRTLVEFPAAAGSVRLPARIIDGRVYVRVTIAGRGLDFLLDSGSVALTIDDGVARALRLPAYGRATMTVAGNFSSQRLIVPRIDIGPLSMRDVVLRTAPLDAQEPQGIRIVGLLGYDFFAATGLRVDYAGGTVDAYRPRTLVPPRGALPVDLRLGSQLPLVRATLGGAASDAFILDTGAEFGYVVLPAFVRAHPDAVERRHDATVEFASGIGGALPYRPLAQTNLEIGSSIELHDASGIEDLAAGTLGTSDVDGIVGSDTLRRFTLLVDYRRNRTWFVLPSRPSSRSRPPGSSVVDGR